MAAHSRQLPVPDWMRVDREAKRVELEIVAGQTEENNRWNLNGLMNGTSDVVVPEGFAIRLTFKNDDPAMAHSLGVEEVQEPWPAVFEDPSPVFEGAISTNPTSATEATKPGASEVLTFTASRAGGFALVCLVPGHAMTGMWIGFVVSAEGAAGVREHG